ncbi:hypothetical protein F5148DRAFT_984134 [Russula earlei]|uniref:Uncharacterized protein n=1 Tax=Russula earlei TaxID=71964 RepID=A0ACC0U3I8_9AGAM|nr:hypothetical protein F5148DRAFT_984134 [Russula earlei]
MSSFSTSQLLSSSGPILITDQLASPGDFLLHQLLSEYVKNFPGGKCIIISTFLDLTKWKAIASRSGFNLAQKLEQGSIVFIDIPTQFPDLSPSKGATFLPLLGLINRYVGIKPVTCLVIFDELSSFEWIGHSASDVSRFARALVASCTRNGVFLAIRYHIASPDDLDDIFRGLFQLCTYHIEVLPLSSGKSSAVSGELALHPGAALNNTPQRVIPRNRALQYRLGEYHSTYFERGMGHAVL